jgi:hypothetical protein
LDAPSPTAELFVFNQLRQRVVLDPKEPALGIKRLLLCPLNGGLQKNSIADLTGQSRPKSKNGIPIKSSIKVDPVVRPGLREVKL